MTLDARVGRYEVEQLVKERGGSVWLLAHLFEPPFTPALIHRVTQEPSAPPFAYAQFLDRARAQQRVKSPHVVRVLEVGSARDDLLVAYEWTPGWTAEEILAVCAEQRHPLPLGVACKLMEEGLLGLAAAHESGVQPLVHGGLDLSRLRLGLDGKGRLTGFARLRERQIRRYRAGAGVEGGTFSRAGDVFTASLILYEMVTGQPVFADGEHGEEGERRVAALRYAPPPDPRERNPELPPQLAAVVTWAVTGERVRQPPSARALAERLHHAAPETPEAEVQAFLAWLNRLAPQRLVSVLPVPGAPRVGAASRGGPPSLHEPTVGHLTPSAAAAEDRASFWAWVSVLALFVIAAGLGGYAVTHTREEPFVKGPVKGFAPPGQPGPLQQAVNRPLARGVSEGAAAEHWVPVTLVTEPPSVVYFRGQRLGSTPLFQARLPEGTRALEFVLPDGKKKNMMLEIEDKPRAGYRLDLRR